MATRRHFLTLSGLFVAAAALAQTDDLCAVPARSAGWLESPHRHSAQKN
jgi:hypothetical protein